MPDALPLTFGSCFAGIGGMDLGLERAGWECRWQIEIDEFCTVVLNKNWPATTKLGDIRTIKGEELERVDLIAGGYPCQPFSQAGRRRGQDDPRHLWPELSRLIRALRPRFVLLENVAGHLSLGFGTVLGDLARLGYDTDWRCFRASDFGASHQRKRVFIVAHHPGDVRWWEPLGLPWGPLPPWPSAAGPELADAGCIPDERWRGPRQFSRQDSPLEGEGDQRERSGDTAGNGGQELADSARGGRRVLRESPGGGGLPDGRGEALAHPDGGQREQRRRAVENEGGQGGRVPGPDGGGRTLGYPAGARFRDGQPREGGEIRDGARGPEPDGRRDAVADALERQLPEPGRRPEGRDGAGSAGALLPDAETERLPYPHQTLEEEPDGVQRWGGSGELCGTFAPGPADPRWPAILEERPDLAPAITTYPSAHNIARDLARQRATCFPRRGRRALRKRLGLEIWLALTEGTAWEKEALAEIRKLAHGIPGGPHRDRLAAASAQEWLGGLKNVDALERAMRHRTKRLSRLGNAIVPQIPEYIGHLIREAAGLQVHYEESATAMLLEDEHA